MEEQRCNSQAEGCAETLSQQASDTTTSLCPTATALCCHEAQSDDARARDGSDPVGNQLRSKPGRHSPRVVLADADLVLPRLYLGSSKAIADEAKLKEQGITHILIAAANIEPKFPEVGLELCNVMPSNVDCLLVAMTRSFNIWCCMRF